MKHAIKNGSLILEEESLLPITQREVQCNFSVYEALRVIDGHVVHLNEHMKRLRNSARMISLSLPKCDFLSSINALIEADSIKDATMRILVVGGKEPVFFITHQDLLTYPDSYYEDGVKATTFMGERYLPTCKTSNLLLSYIALEDSKSKGGFEALLVNRDGRITEGTRSNFYVIRNNELLTAPDEEVLSGVTRISVLEAAKLFGLKVVFKSPTPEDALSGDVCFISSTSMAAMPISSIDGKPAGHAFGIVLKIRDYVRLHERD